MTEPLMRNPYAASKTRSSDVITTEWPPVTPTELAEVLRTQERYGDNVNLKSHSLMRASQRLSEAILAIGEARRHWSKDREEMAHRVVERLDQLARALKEARAQFPLTVVNR